MNYRQKDDRPSAAQIRSMRLLAETQLLNDLQNRRHYDAKRAKAKTPAEKGQITRHQKKYGSSNMKVVNGIKEWATKHGLKMAWSFYGGYGLDGKCIEIFPVSFEASNGDIYRANSPSDLTKPGAAEAYDGATHISDLRDSWSADKPLTVRTNKQAA